MKNREIAAILFNISTILSEHHANPYRVRAYRRAARNLLRLRYAVADRVRAGQPLGIPLLGKSLTAKITQLAGTGSMSFYDEICAWLPPEEQALLRVPGMGPTLAARVHRDLGQIDADSVRRAADSGQLQRVWGIGPRRAAAILDTLASPAMRQEQLDLR